MTTFINMDYDNVNNNWWVEYIDDDNQTRKDTFDSEAEAIAIANDTPYGLAAYLQTGNASRALRVAAQLRAGAVHINGGGFNYGSPFGGYKQSGNGREWGPFGFDEFLEIKAILGYNVAQ